MRYMPEKYTQTVFVRCVHVEMHTDCENKTKEGKNSEKKTNGEKLITCDFENVDPKPSSEWLRNRIPVHTMQ